MSQRNFILATIALLLIAGLAGIVFLSNNGQSPRVVAPKVTATPESDPESATGSGAEDDAGDLILRGEVTGSGGIPLEGVEVNAFAPDGRTYLAATDDLGRFAIAVEADDWYRVSLRKSGYVKRTGIPIQPGNESKRYRLNRLSDSVTSTGNTDIGIPDRIDFSGAVVRYQDRQPLEGVDVRITDRDDKIHEAVTDASGGFELTGLRPGEISVEARLANHVLLFPRQPTDVSAAVRDFLIEMAATGSVSGIVVDSASRPASAAHLRIEYLTGDGPRLTQIAESVTADGSGEFVLPNVAILRRLRLQADWTSRNLTSFMQPGKRGSSGEVILRSPGGRAEVRIVLDTPNDEMLVTKGHVNLRVLDTDGSPRPDARVRAERLRGFSSIPSHLGDGVFKILIPIGERVTLKADTADRSCVAVSGVDAASDSLTLTLKPGGRLEVNVRDASGNPVPNYRIHATFTQPGDDGVVPMVNHPGVDRWTPVNSPDGAFVYEGLDGGIYRITASHPRKADGVAEHIIVQPGQESEIDIALTEGVELEGRVIDAGSGAPVPEADVEVSPRRAYAALLEGSAGAVLRTTTDNNGKFLFENLNPGAYDFAASHPDFGSGRLSNFQVPDGGEAEIVLMTGGRLEGVVHDSRSNVVEGARIVIVTGRDKGRQAGAETDSAGHYAIEGLPSGMITAHCLYPESGEMLMESVKIRDGETTILDFGGSGVRLYGSVTSAGSPVEGAILRIRKDGNLGRSIGSSVTATTAGDGSYEFPAAFSPGTWILTVSAGQTTAWYERLEIPSRADELRHDVALPANKVSGRVVSARTGEGVSGAQVILEADARAVETSTVTRISGYWTALAYGRSAEDGSFEFDRVPMGAVRVRASAEGHAPGETDSLILGADETRDGVMLLLQPGSGVSGVITSWDGAPIAGAAVAAFAKDEAGNWYTVSRTKSGANGAYALEDLGEGDAAVAAVAPGYAVGVEHRVYVPDNNAVTVDLALEDAYGGFLLTVESHLGEPVSNVRVQIEEDKYWMPWVSHGGTFLASYGWTGGDGKVLCGNLPVGDHVLLLTGTAYPLTHRQGVAIENGGRTPVQVNLVAETSP